MDDLIAFTIVEWSSIVLTAILVFLGIRVLGTGGSHTPGRPFLFEDGIRTGEINSSLQRMEKTFDDKIRFYTFWFQVRRLKKSNIAGVFAEVGVYRGETAKIIHAMDANRKFYLFDTFEGFPVNDLESETMRPGNRSLDFSNTSAETVREYMQGNDNVIFRAGYFPDTATSLTETFALVSLDADLYKPTLEGLRYFYPRLEDGGVIIVHDYNHTWDGVKKAVDEFVAGISETPVEVADWQGSVMIVRNKRF